VDELAHRFGFVTTEIVHDHDVAGGDEQTSRRTKVRSDGLAARTAEFGLDRVN